MEFDSVGNVISGDEVEVVDPPFLSNRNFAKLSVGSKDRITKKFIKMNKHHWREPLHPSTLVKAPKNTNEDKDDLVITTEKAWLEYATCHFAMLHSRDQICRFADDVLGFGELKESQSHSGGYIITKELIQDLVLFLSQDHFERQKKKNIKFRNKKKATPAKEINFKTIFMDFGTKTNSFRLYWKTMRLMMKWESSGWLSSTCMDFIGQIVNLSLGHAPNENIYPSSLMADSMTGLGITPWSRDADRHPIMAQKFTPDFEENFTRCVRKVWFPEVKTNVKRSLYCYKAIDLPMPKIAFPINTSELHWEALSVNFDLHHVWSMDPFLTPNNLGGQGVNWYRRWAAKYFGMYHQIVNGNASPYAGHKDMIREWKLGSIDCKRQTLAKIIGQKTSSFSHCDVDFMNRTDVPKQKDHYNCGLYAWHYSYSFLFNSKCDPKFDPNHFRRRLVFFMILTRSFINRDGGSAFYPQPDSRSKKGVQRLVMKTIPNVLTWFVDHVRTRGFGLLADRLMDFEISTAPLTFYYDPRKYQFGDGEKGPQPVASADLDNQTLTQDCNSKAQFFEEIDADSDYDADSKERLKGEFDQTYTPRLKIHNLSSDDDDDSSDGVDDDDDGKKLDHRKKAAVPTSPASPCIDESSDENKKGPSSMDVTMEKVHKGKVEIKFDDDGSESSVDIVTPKKRAPEQPLRTKLFSSSDEEPLQKKPRGGKTPRKNLIACENDDGSEDEQKRKNTTGGDDDNSNDSNKKSSKGGSGSSSDHDSSDGDDSSSFSGSDGSDRGKKNDDDLGSGNKKDDDDTTESEKSNIGFCDKNDK